jgi:hypothetical protein
MSARSDSGAPKANAVSSAAGAEGVRVPPVMVRLEPPLLAALDAWVERLNATTDGPPWTRGEVVRAALARALEERGAAGEAP